MPLSNNISAGDVPHSILSAAAIATVLYMPVIKPGRIKDFHVTVGDALATADQLFTLAYAAPGVGAPTFVDVVNGTLTQLFTSSAAGITVRRQLALGNTAAVQDGGTIRITPSGGGSAGVPLTISVVIGN